MKRDRGVTLASNGGYWQASWWDSAGVRRRRGLGPKSALSRQAAMRECRRIEAEQIVTPASKNTGRAPTLKEWREQYFRVRAGEIKDGTATLHRQTFARLSERFGEGIRLDRITRAAAAEFRAWLGEQEDKRTPGKTIGPLSVGRHVRDCKVIFGLAVRLEQIPTNPFEHVKSGGTVASEWRYIPLDELDRILAACPDDDWRRAFALARLSGMRRGEILRLTWGDVGGSTIRVLPEVVGGVRREGTKQRTRTVPVQPRLSRKLKGGGPRDELVCRIPTENLHRTALSIVRRAGVEVYAKPFHTLKKSLASDWLGEGLPVSDVAQWLGDSVDVLMKHYARFLKGNAARVTGQVDIVAELRERLARLEAENNALKARHEVDKSSIQL